MTKYPLKTKTRIDLRTILSEGVLAVLVLADAGTPIQDAVQGRVQK